MSFDWEDFLKVAEILHDGASGAKLEEAMFRIAISRAYYAAFCLCRNWKEDNGKTIPAKDAHKFIIELYENSEDEIEIAIGQKLRRLRHRRNEADYDDEVNNLDKLSLLALKDSREILDALAKLK
jgi:uncharacterized protein (UPF0332 family)